MGEHLFQWNYVVAAYLIGVSGTLGLVGWALAAMKASENRREKTRKRR